MQQHCCMVWFGLFGWCILPNARLTRSPKHCWAEHWWKNLFESVSPKSLYSCETVRSQPKPDCREDHLSIPSLSLDPYRDNILEKFTFTFQYIIYIISGGQISLSLFMSFIFTFQTKNFLIHVLSVQKKLANRSRPTGSLVVWNWLQNYSKGLRPEEQEFSSLQFLWHLSLNVTCLLSTP